MNSAVSSNKTLQKYIKIVAGWLVVLDSGGPAEMSSGGLVEPNSVGLIDPWSGVKIFYKYSIKRPHVPLLFFQALKD